MKPFVYIEQRNFQRPADFNSNSVDGIDGHLLHFFSGMEGGGGTIWHIIAHQFALYRVRELWTVPLSNLHFNFFWN